MKESINIFWFRRDLRLEDNTGLFHALTSKLPVLPVFIFDSNILNKLEDKNDARVNFIHQTITGIHLQLQHSGAGLKVLHASPLEAFKELTGKYHINTVFANDDYEPYAISRDAEVADYLENENCSFKAFKDHVIFEKNEVLKDNSEPYSIFTAYSRKWKSLLDESNLKNFPSEKHIGNFLKYSTKIPSIAQLGFRSTELKYPAVSLEKSLVMHYARDRDFPGKNATSHIGVHLRFGTISIRRLVRETRALSDTYLNELIWRDFYQMILWHFPHIAYGKSFKPVYDNIEWLTDNGEFEKWCNGKTGYPMVDAGMRELNATGFMHNRVRMVTASFLSKHLLIDWRLGEAYFARKLLDYDFAANNGGWQWAAGTGCDAAPYFRIFNPYLQTKRFDPELSYIKKWVPEFQEFSYPKPIVNHEFARKRCLEVYGKALKNDKEFF